MATERRRHVDAVITFSRLDVNRVYVCQSCLRLAGEGTGITMGWILRSSSIGELEGWGRAHKELDNGLYFQVVDYN